MYTLTEIGNHEIANNSMNIQLTDLYSNLPNELSDAIAKFNEKVSEGFISNPFLLAVTDEYFKASKKIMLIAQETFCWFGERNRGIYTLENSIVELQNLYDLFVNNPSRNYASPLWLYVNSIYCIARNVNAGVIFNNVAKIGFNDRTGYDSKINVYFDRIFREEMSICKPDLIIFLSGPNYDSLIKQRLGVFSLNRCIPNIAERKLAKFFFDSSSLKK